MKTWPALFAALALPSTVTAAASATSQLGARAKSIIAVRLVDPGSLVVRNTHTATVTADGQTLTLWCGEYNSKNRFGGYVGFKAFVYEPAVMKGVLTLGEEYDYDFFAESGSGDFLYHDGDKEMEAAAPEELDAVADRIREANSRYAHFAIEYFPVCLGHS